MTAPGLAWFPASSSPDGVDRGRLTVPAVWGRPAEGEPFALPVRRYRARVGQASRVVIFLAGGPGESGLAAAQQGPIATLIEEIRHWADVITFDQRGTGDSQPALPQICSWQLAPADQLSRDLAISRARDLSAVCAENWYDRGVNPNTYNITQSAADVSFLVNSLDYDGVSLFGTSYGTQLGLSVMRLRHDFEAAVLLNVEAPHQTVKLPHTSDEYMVRCLQALSTAPVDAEVIRARLSELIFGDTRKIDVPGIGPVSLGTFEVQRGISRCLGSRSMMTRLASSLIVSPSDFLMTVGMSARKWKSGPFDSLQLVVDSASGISEARLERFENECRSSLLGDSVDFPLPYVSRSLGLDDVGEDARGLVTSNVPVLFVSGELDARTPPVNVTEIVAGFQLARPAVVPFGLHEPEFYLSDPTVLAMITNWLREGGD